MLVFEILISLSSSLKTRVRKISRTRKARRLPKGRLRVQVLARCLEAVWDGWQELARLQFRASVPSLQLDQLWLHWPERGGGCTWRHYWSSDRHGYSRVR